MIRSAHWRQITTSIPAVAAMRIILASVWTVTPVHANRTSYYTEWAESEKVAGSRQTSSAMPNVDRVFDPLARWRSSAVFDHPAGGDAWIPLDRIMHDEGPISGPPDSSLGTDDLWWDGFFPLGAVGPPGRSIDTYVLALAVYRGELIVGGDFAFMDGVESRGIVAWDGQSWHPLGTKHEFWGANCFAIHNDRLIAGGSTGAKAGVSSVYVWNGEEWEGLGSSPGPMMGPYSSVYNLEIFNGQLIATGAVFRNNGPERFISQWDGAAWEDIGPDSLYGEYPFLTDLAVYRDTLYVAGGFHLSADDSVGNLARWRDGSWEVVGGGTDGRVSSLEVYRDELIVGGRFSYAGNVPANNIAAWNGTRWATLGEGLQSDRYSNVGTLLVSNDRLFVGGGFDSAGDIPVRDVAVWDGAAWDSLAPLPHSRIFPICLTSFENRIIAGGRFALGRSNGAANVMAWDGGTTWSPVSTWGVELVETPRALLATDEGLVCDGEFTLPGQLESKSAIARWDGSDWQVMGDQLDLPVSAFALFRGQIVAAGWFQMIDGDSLHYVARWDGDSWHPLGAGLSGPALALAVHRDRLIVAGTFVYAGGEPVPGIAEWDGQSWRRFGSGILGRVTDVEIYNDEVYACGRFTWAGDTPVRSIAKWNGVRWESIDRELTFQDDDPWVGHLEVWNGQLVAAGNFETVAGAESRDLAIWDGIHWRSLTPLLNMVVSELASDQGRLVVGGAFFGPNGYPDQDYIRQWDGSRWLRMGSGLSSGRDGYFEFPGVTAIARWNDDLYVSGFFRFAGRNPSFRIARWDGTDFDSPISRPTLTVAPNPAVDTVHFGWHLDDPGNVQLRVFNVLGREVARPVRGLQPGGPGTEQWALIDNQGKHVPAGVYFVRLESERGSTVNRVVVLR